MLVWQPKIHQKTKVNIKDLNQMILINFIGILMCSIMDVYYKNPWLDLCPKQKIFSMSSYLYTLTSLWFSRFYSNIILV